MGATHYLTKRLKNVSTETSLHALAYNLKRMMKIKGTIGLSEGGNEAIEGLICLKILVISHQNRNINARLSYPLSPSGKTKEYQTNHKSSSPSQKSEHSYSART